ncbi:hypothetical protein FISHEDRAFT_41892 [Fistulina hepatica ATCC 64428]|nr:hypothetical protein FISHEDRAFT_41892 [Fistulina hepatica ATCC 64428]
MAKADDSAKKKHTDDEPLPPDAGQKPIVLQRRRVWRACESCRRKKIKCDGTEPVCSQCSTSGSQCTWLQTKDRAALSRHYVQELEARLIHMESVFNNLSPILQQHGINVDDLLNGTSAAVPSSSLTSSKPAAKSVAAPAPTSVTSSGSSSESPPNVKVEEDVSDAIGQLALDEYGHLRWIGGSSSMPLIQSFRNMTTSPLHRISPMEEDPQAPGPSVNKVFFPASVFFGKLHALPSPEEVDYPDRDLANKLVDAYFARLHYLMPIIDKPSFMRDYAILMDNLHDVEKVRNETAFIGLVFAVFACAASLVQDPRLATERAEEGGMGMIYYERALILQYISHARTQLGHVQCLALMSSFLCSVNCLPQAWILIGQAVRIAQDLGLHRSPRRLLLTPIDKETRRKVWWGVYTLDRMLALALGRPLGINDSDCDVEYPVEIDDEYLPEYFSVTGASASRTPLMTGFVALIKLYQIAGRVLQEVYAVDLFKESFEVDRQPELHQRVAALDAEVERWVESIPSVFKNQSETDEQVSVTAVLCSHYYSVLTTLHRNLLPVKQNHPVTAASATKAVASARSSIRLAPSMKNVVPLSHHLAFFIQHLFSSAVILLLYAMHANDPKASGTAMEEAQSALVALESWEGVWPGARKCKDLLKELTTTAKEAIARANALQPRTPSAMPPSIVEHRRSVTIAALPQGTKSSHHKTRRNLSRDSAPSTASRRLNAVSPYRSSQRARSASRRRGDADPTSASLASFYTSLASPVSPPHQTSNHSSPSSLNSPGSAGNITQQQQVPHLDPQDSNSPHMNFGYTPTLAPNDTRAPGYDLNFGNMTNDVAGLGSSMLSGGGPWAGDPSALDMGYNFNSFNSPSGLAHFEDLTLNPVVEQPNTEFSEAQNHFSSDPAFSDTSFTANGLPFRGLEYIRNYNPTGLASGSSNDQDLWPSYDSSELLRYGPNTFDLTMDTPFSLTDISTDS